MEQHGEFASLTLQRLVEEAVTLCNVITLLLLLLLPSAAFT